MYTISTLRFVGFDFMGKNYSSSIFYLKTKYTTAFDQTPAHSHEIFEDLKNQKIPCLSYLNLCISSLRYVVEKFIWSKIGTVTRNVSSSLVCWPYKAHKLKI